MNESSNRKGSNRKIRVFLESLGFVAVAWGFMIGFSVCVFAGMMLKAYFWR